MGLLSSLHARLYYLKLRIKIIRHRLVIPLIKLILFFVFPRPTHKLSIPSGKHRIKLHVYCPPNAPPGPKPVHITWHGSGFTLPLLGTNAPFCALLARRLGCIVIDADYRKAPEYPFPAAYDDACTVVRWVLDNPHPIANAKGLKFQFDTQRVSIGGFSAGANLALAVAGAGPFPAGSICGLIAFYPSTDYTIPYASKHSPPAEEAKKLPMTNGTMLSLSTATLFRQCYQRDLGRLGLGLDDPRLSPRYVPEGQLDRFPGKGRTMILTCEYDRLDWEGQEMARVLREAGREPVVKRVEGMGHGWDGSAREGTEGGRLRREMYEVALEVLGRAYGGE